VRTVADLRQAEGDDVILGPPTPVWHIRAGTARRIDADLEAPRLAAVAGTIAAACQLPGGPLIKHVGPGGHSVHYGYPGTIITLDDTRTVQGLGKVASTRGVICEDRGRVWALGFDSEIGDPAGGGGVRELLLAEGRPPPPACPQGTQRRGRRRERDQRERHRPAGRCRPDLPLPAP
jgi:hypothetical protein